MYTGIKSTRVHAIIDRDNRWENKMRIQYIIYSINNNSVSYFSSNDLKIYNTKKQFV